MFITRRISLVRGILYVAVQCGGAAIASIILKRVGYIKSYHSIQSTMQMEDATSVVCQKLLIIIFAKSHPRQVLAFHFAPQVLFGWPIVKN